MGAVYAPGIIQQLNDHREKHTNSGFGLYDVEIRNLSEMITYAKELHKNKNLQMPMSKLQ
jgi:alpha-galactosidase/6-phospho-beta-glucosidase family protein